MFDALVVRHNGIFGGCWCMFFHPDSDERGEGAEGNRAMKRRYVERCVAHAALVIDGDEAVAWAEYPHIPGEKRLSSSFLYDGTRAMYERCGFDFVRPQGLKNTVMRRTVAPAA